MIFFGALLMFAIAISIVMDVVMSSEMTGRSGSSRMLGKLTFGTAGVLWVVAGAMFWKRRWWVAVICLGTGYALGVFAASRM